MSIKKTIIATVLALALVAVIAPVGAKADQLSDLMAQINALTAQLNALQAGSAGTQVGTGFCTGVTFDTTLNVGSTGSEVKCLQSILNSTGISQTVTGTFGAHTLAGVKAFQTKYGITASGNVGPLTRAQLTIAEGTVTPATPAATLCPNGNTIASSCTLAPNAQAQTALCPNGNTLSSNCTTGVVSTATGTTGFLSLADIAASPASNANVTATSNVPVLGLDLKAIGSNLTVNSIKVALAVTKNGATQYPSTVVETMYVYDGSTLLGTFPVNSSTVVTDNSVNPNAYYVILSGFNFQIPGNTTKTLTINADFPSSLDTSRVLTVGLYGTDAIRATDASGAYSTAGGSNASARQYTITYTTVGTSTLTVAQDTATTLSASVNVNHTSGVNNIPALVFDAKSTTGASNITNLKFTVTGDNAAVAKTTAVELFDGSTLIGSQSLSSAVSGATASFNNLNIAVAQDATKVLTAEVNLGSGVTNGTGIIVSIANPATDVTYQQPNMSSTNPTSSAVTGNEQYLFDGATADLSFQNASSVYTYNSTTPSASYTSGVITFNAKADGGTLTALTNGTVEVSAYYNGAAHILSSSNVNVDFAPIGGTDNANLSDGGTAVVTVNVTLPRSTSGTGFINFYIDKVTWTIGSQSGPITTQQTWLNNYKTPFANVQ
jgi:peptidoglycan hydrolase-like protein with peptidoglycan-binding domain